MANQKSTDAAIKNIEMQVGQLSKQLADQHKGNFFANTQDNPKEHCKCILTRSGRKIDMGIGDEVEEEEIKDNSRHYARFLDIFSQLQINIPYYEALEQMPTYEKFMKGILTNKRRYIDQETITLDASCSIIIQRTLPQKESDPGKVTLPVIKGNIYIGKGLIDLGSIINLIPLSIVKRLGSIELKTTRMTMQLANKSITHPHGVAEDVLVKMDKFLFPVDFVVIEMEEEDDAPLILGRTFMNTARMMIDIDDGVIKVRVQDEEACFNIFEAMKHSKDKNDCFQIDTTDKDIMEVKRKVHVSTPLEKALTNVIKVLKED
ncbi:uncharacterized protein LOC127093876 [Lathyrus oleraceus]|uniref:uncharacterized protein LOC127093876 n=1 Tax=Pisum sativum TaxID=3888 RepID=UPI0021CF1841|nr:uncharacterized protein LOC127093876 [Pisum sativum]